MLHDKLMIVFILVIGCLIFLHVIIVITIVYISSVFPLLQTRSAPEYANHFSIMPLSSAHWEKHKPILLQLLPAAIIMSVMSLNFDMLAWLSWFPEPSFVLFFWGFFYTINSWAESPHALWKEVVTWWRCFLSYQCNLTETPE